MADAGVCRLLGRALHADDAINETLELITLPSRRHMSARHFVYALENDILFFFLPNVGGAVAAHVLQEKKNTANSEAQGEILLYQQ